MSSVDRVRAYLDQYGLGTSVQVLDADTATVATAAAALNVAESRIAKSLSFKKTEGGCLLVVAAGDAKVDNRRFKDQFGFKATMLKGDEVKELTGHGIGGVCPFALKEEVEVYLDASLNRFDTVFPACGSANSVIELSVAQLTKITPITDNVDVCKGWREDGS